MLDNVLNFALHSPYEQALRVGLFLIAACLLTMLAIRLAMSLVSVGRVKARKQWMVEPPLPGSEQSLIDRMLYGVVEDQATETLLSDEVRAMLEQVATRRDPSAAILRLPQ